jgi:hypothetical protein
VGKDDAVGTPVEKGPWNKGTWVWHVRTRKGPWIVVEDGGGQLVYVDTKPNRPATRGRNHYVDPHRYDVTLDHSDIEHHYRSVLTDKEPAPLPHWTSKVNWEKFGKGIGVGIGIVILGLIALFFFWLDAGAPLAK